MKKRIYKLISSLLILACLVSCFSIFAFAADNSQTGQASVTENDVNLIVNRTYDEGWGYQNGFTTTKVGSNKFSIEYEETEDFSYNYYCRVESIKGELGYAALEYGSSTVTYGNTIFELDIKTDDVCNFSNGAKSSSVMPVLYVKADKDYALANISNNGLLLPQKGNITNQSVPSFDIGNLGNGWIHVAYVFTVNQRQCTSCGRVHTMSDEISESAPLCCLETKTVFDPETNETREEITGGVTPQKMTKMFNIRIYYSYSDSFDPSNAIATPKKATSVNLENTYYHDINISGNLNFKSIHFGIPKNAAARGQSYLVDNVRAYSGTDVPGVKVSGYGVKVDETAAKTETIISANSGKTAIEYINSGVVMKVGSDLSLTRGVQKPIFQKDGKAYGAPVKIDGEVYVPLQPILDWVGFPMYTHDDGVSLDISTASGSTFITIGRNTATASGQTVNLKTAPKMLKDAETGAEFVVVSKDDIETLVPGCGLTYDDMGLIIISEGKDLLDRDSGLDIMLDVMKRFLFVEKSADEIYDSAKETTNNFAHPYLFATQDDFNALNSAYKAQSGDVVYDANLKAYLSSLVTEAEAIYAKYANTDDVINSTKIYLKEELVNPYVNVQSKLSNNGYSFYTGNNEELVTYAEEIRLLAFAYQVTGELKYAFIAYEMAVDLGEWKHWAPAFFVNCADATAAYATAYDWLYNVWTSEACKLDVTPIEAAIYQKGIYIGNIFTVGDTINDDINSNQGVYSVYPNATDSWNVIGTSGMVIASLAMLGSDFVKAEEGASETDAMGHIKTILGSNIQTLIQNGLDAYAPDGSYIQSPEYWSESTGALIRMIWALENCIGDSMGLTNLWGLDNTFYYAYQIEYKVAITENNTAGYDHWNYHESALGVLNTDSFLYAAEILGDDVIGAIRVEQLATKKASIWDVLAYDAKYAGVDVASANISRDYFLDSCEGFVSRSDFSDKAIYVGMMAGPNDAPTGQVDSGNFIYASRGFTWFGDLGSDTNTLYEYLNDSHRYNYYRVTGEGNNVVLLTTSSLSSTFPYGQTLNAGGVFTDYYTNDYGMYAIIDNSSVYTGKVNTATRGLLFTNNRSTVVIQDDIRFIGAQACTWIVHTAAESIILNEDGRTAYLTQKIGGKDVYLRLTIHEPGDATGLKFEKYSTKQNILSTTYKDNYSTLMGYTAENDRSNFTRLVIKQSEQVSFQCAVVIETLDVLNTNKPVEYEYTDLNRWNQSMVKETFTATELDDNYLTTPIVTDIFVYTAEAKGYVDNDRAFSIRFREFYRAMVRVASIIKTYEPTGELTNVINKVNPDKDPREEYQEYLVKFDFFRAEINSYVTDTQSLSTYITGYN